MPIDKNETDQTKYERDFLLMLILNEEEFGPGAFERAVEKVKASPEKGPRTRKPAIEWAYERDIEQPMMPQGDL